MSRPRARRIRFLLPLLFSATARAAGPAEPEQATIGWFLPDRGPDAELGREIRRGLDLALAGANRLDAGAGLSYRAVGAASDSNWGTAASGLVRLIYEEGASVVIGGVDSRSAHLAEQVITRARGRAVFLNPWASETRLTRIRIPWFFRLPPDDRRQGERLAREIFAVRGGTRAAVWTEPGVDFESAIEGFLRAAPPDGLVRIGEAAGADAPPAADAGALVLFGSPGSAAEFLRHAAGTNRGGARFGPLSLARGDFLASAGPAAEGMVLVAPAPEAACGPAAAAFRAAFLRAHGREPGPAAAYGHDAAEVAIEAIRRTRGGDGDRLAEAIRGGSFPGILGPITFDANGDAELEAGLAVVRGGALRPLESAPDGREGEEIPACRALDRATR